MDANSGTHRWLSEKRAFSRSMAKRTRAISLVVSALFLAACSDNGEVAGGGAPTSSPPPVSMSTEPAESQTGPPWLDDFTADEIAVYEAALARWQEYSEKSAQIYRLGRDTEAARATFREYDMQAVARIKSLAEEYDAQGLRTLQGPVPLSTKPVSVEPRVVVISQCNDYTDVEVSRAGEPVAGVQPKNLRTPITIEMDKPAGHDWMVARVQLKDEKPCSA